MLSTILDKKYLPWYFRNAAAKKNRDGKQMITLTDNAELVDAIAVWDGEDQQSLDLILDVLAQSI